MSEELMVPEAGNLVPVVSSVPQSMVEAMATSRFLPRLSLITAKSPAVNEGFPANHFALTENKVNKDLGEKVDVVLVGVRMQYLDMSVEPPLSFYHPEASDDGEPTHPACLSIKERSFDQMSKCLWGPQFLVWIPGQGKFATFLMGTFSARIEADNLYPFLGKGCTLTPKMIKSKKHKTSWMIPTPIACTTITELPAPSLLKKVMDSFQNEEDSPLPEVAEPTTQRKR